MPARFERWWRRLALLALACAALPGGARAADEPALHDHAFPAGAGLHKELIEGITEDDFLKLGKDKNHVVLTLIASFTGANQGMNFNGYHHGEATFTVPAGWTVDVNFINPSPVPHSAVIVEMEKLSKVQPGDPCFKGGSSPSPVYGTSASKVNFSFVADEAGEYAFACGIPTHATAGHWVRFLVIENGTVPCFQAGEGAAREAK